MKQKFRTVKPCSVHTGSASHLIWLQMKNVPVFVWGYDFFETIVQSLGRLVCLDGPMAARTRFDVAQVLVDLSTLEIVCQYVTVNIDGEQVKVWLEPDYDKKQLSIVPSIRPAHGIENSSVDADWPVTSGCGDHVEKEDVVLVRDDVDHEDLSLLDEDNSVWEAVNQIADIVRRRAIMDVDIAGNADGCSVWNWWVENQGMELQNQARHLIEAGYTLEEILELNMFQNLNFEISIHAF